jgi:hypothetical protein
MMAMSGVPPQPTASDSTSAYADSGVSATPGGTPAFSAVWGTSEAPDTADDGSDDPGPYGAPEAPAAAGDPDTADTSDGPETPAAVTIPGELVDEPAPADEATPADEAASVAAADGEDDAAPSAARASGSCDLGAPASSPAGARLAGAPGDLDGPLLGDVADLRTSWQRVQAGFVDDPRESVADAADLVEHAAQALVGALRQRQRLLRAAWERGGPADGAGVAASDPAADAAGGQPAADDVPDTEQLRLLIQRYRTLFNEICRP